MTEGLKSRIERVALCADLASHYIQDMRVMPAEGVKMVQRDALARIEELEAKLQDMALDCLAAQGQAEEAYQAQRAAEGRLEIAIAALNQIEQGWIDEADPDTGVSIQVNMAADEMEDIARDAIAKIKGDR
jgi:hypothetical protein